jgi:hypothetical protein
MCCGYAQLPDASWPEASGPPRVVFEYQGHGPLTIYGRVTGSRYHFPGPAARVPVDGRDAPYLEVIRGLETVGEAKRDQAR